MPDPRNTLPALLERIRACTACAGLPLGPRPVIQAHRDARLVIVGHAPGRKVHASGVPWDDLSGDRLRQWLGISREIFYDPRQVASLGMSFCYPGTGKSGDLPPRKECAPLWHREVLARLNVDVPLVLIGRHAAEYYLGERRKETLTETVRAWKEYQPRFLVLPHPSGRNNAWLKKNPWFESAALPRMRRIIRKALRA